MYFRKKIKYLALLAFVFCVACGNGPELISLTEWEVLYAQEESLEKAMNMKGWEPVDFPSKIHLPYTPVRGFQYFWLRSRFNIEGDPSAYYGISTGRIQYIDKTYINGDLIGFSNPDEVNWGLQPRHYSFPRGVLKKGVNEIYMQLGVYGKYPGGVLNYVFILSENDFKYARFIRELLNKYIPVGTVIIIALITIVLFVFYLLDRREKLFFFYLFILTATIMYILIPLSSIRLFSFELFSAIMFSMFPAFMLFFFFIFQRAYKIYLKKHNIIFTALLSLFTAIILFTRDELYNYQIAFILTFITLIIMVPLIFFLLFRLNSLSPDRFLFTMLFTIFFISLSSMGFEFYSAVTGGTHTGMVAKNIPLLLILLGMITYVREQVKRKRDMEFITERYNKYKERKVVINNTSEEKLKTVIDLINENYTSDLSREGLAAVVDLHPNYLGKIFKVYTRKTINDYINNLRIEEAKKRITKGHEKIVDIAFSTGFESLATFHRVFKNVTGKSPSEFKDIN